MEPRRHQSLVQAGRFLFLCLLGFFPGEAPAQTGRISFTDIAPQSEFSYVTNNDFRGRKYFVQPMCGGVAIFDYDNDGWMDLFFTNGAKLPELEKTGPAFHNALLRNKHDGKFEDVTEHAGLAGAQLGYSLGAAAGDYDNDGWTDLFVVNADRNTLYHNEGDGTFADVIAGSGLASGPPETLGVQAAWLDYDNDGLLDLAVSNYALWTPQKDQRCLNEGQDYYCHPRTYTGVPPRLYRNRGGGVFEDVTEAAGFGKLAGKGMGIAVADVNDDGWIDMFLANDTERNFLFVNQGDGSFQEAALLYGVAYNDDGTTVSAMGSDAKDFDNDGRVDIFYNDLMDQGWGLFRNQRGTSFRYASPATKIARLSHPFSGWSGGFIDYNNDGWKDIYSANGDVDNLTPRSPQHDTMFENQAGKQFVDVSQSLGRDFLRVGYQRGASFGDLNNDGFLDLVVTSLNERPRILISSGNGNHWLLLTLVGRKSNRDAVGAKVKIVTPSGTTLYNHVTASVGFLSSSDLRVHFGLGSEEAADVEIRWPSGQIQALKNVAADSIHRVEEPQLGEAPAAAGQPEAARP